MPNPSLIALLRADLESAGLSVETLSDLWGADAAAALRRGHRLPAQRATTTPSPRATLARLFVLGLPVERTGLEAALPALGVDGAVTLGLVGGDDLVHPLVDLRPYSFVDDHGVGAWWIASDLGETALGGALREDHVLGIGGASTTLSSLMIHRRVGLALDLGTGCGIQAMHASRHADRVIATDISARAIELARFNAELNAIANIEFRLGDLFAPVEGIRFDHIVSNPPFVITPRAEGVPAYEYRDGGMVGDDLVAAVVGGVAERLAPGGIAQLLGNWEYRADSDAFDRIGSWLDRASLPLDAWVIEREEQDAALYAETWIRDGGTLPGPDFDRLYSAWLDDFAHRGVRAVGFGYVLLRAPAGTQALRRLERLPGQLGHNPIGLGGHLLECLSAHDWLTGVDDWAIGRSHLTAAADVTEERHYWPGAEDPTVMTLHQGGGFGRSVQLDTGLAAFVGACDGDLPVVAIIEAIAQLLEVDATALHRELLPAVRELILTGFLTV